MCAFLKLLYTFSNLNNFFLYKYIYMAHQNNFVKTLKRMSNAAKIFDTLV